MGIESSVGLIVATLDLQLVRMLRAAMRPGDGGADSPWRLIHPAPEVQPRKRAGAGAQPMVEPRPHVRPEPVFEPRMKLGGGDSGPAWVAPCAGIAPAGPVESAARSTSPVQPPWKVRPWEQEVAPPPRPVRKIKVFVTRSDSYCKGSVIDLFI